MLFPANVSFSENNVAFLENTVSAENTMSTENSVFAETQCSPSTFHFCRIGVRIR